MCAKFKRRRQQPPNCVFPWHTERSFHRTFQLPFQEKCNIQANKVWMPRTADEGATIFWNIHATLMNKTWMLDRYKKRVNILWTSHATSNAKLHSWRFVPPKPHRKIFCFSRNLSSHLSLPQLSTLLFKSWCWLTQIEFSWIGLPPARSWKVRYVRVNLVCVGFFLPNKPIAWE